MYRGDHHRWRCQQCIDQYLADGARKADARLAVERVQRLAKAKTSSTTSTTTPRTMESKR
jgi:hypothetical protein